MMGSDEDMMGSDEDMMCLDEDMMGSDETMDSLIIVFYNIFNDERHKITVLVHHE